jgi:hypothetical protein
MKGCADAAHILPGKTTVTGHLNVPPVKNFQLFKE